jgi:hypothetical protein
MFKKTLAFICIFFAVAAVEPLAGAGSPIGTMDAFGPAEVRAVRTRQATLFSGDHVRSLHDAYVNVFLNGGHHVGLSSNTEVTLTKESDQSKIVMLAGELGFASSATIPLQLQIQSLTVQAEPGTTGSITSTSTDLVSVAMVKGQSKVRNSESGEFYVLRPGTTTVFGLHGREPLLNLNTTSVGAPGPKQNQQPTPPPSQPPATIKVPPPSGTGKSTKVVIIAAAAGGVAAIAIIAATRGDSASPSMPR